MFVGLGLIGAELWWLQWIAALNLAGVGFYLAIVTGTGLALSLRRGRPLGGAVIAVAITATHLGLAIGFLRGWFERGRVPEPATGLPVEQEAVV